MTEAEPTTEEIPTNVSPEPEPLPMLEGTTVSTDMNVLTNVPPNDSPSSTDISNTMNRAPRPWCKYP